MFVTVWFGLYICTYIQGISWGREKRERKNTLVVVCYVVNIRNTLWFVLALLHFVNFAFWRSFGNRILPLPALEGASDVRHLVLLVSSGSSSAGFPWGRSFFSVQFRTHMMMKFKQNKSSAGGTNTRLIQMLQQINYVLHCGDNDSKPTTPIT